MNREYDLLMTILLIASSGVPVYYFFWQVANRWNLVAIPIERSSHNKPVVQGAGIVILLQFGLVYLIFGRPELSLVITGSALGILGFADDIRPISAQLKLLIQVLILGVFLFYMPGFEVWVMGFIFLYFLAVINTFNFMDGINGMLGGYSLLTFSSIALIYYLSDRVVPVHIFPLMLITLTFCAFNFRKSALFFAGDSGSLFLGFLAGYEILRLIIYTGDWIWISLLGVFGADAGLTLLKRVWKRANPFKAHREHLYEKWVHEGRASHLTVSGSYIAFQGLISMLVLIQYFTGITTGIISVIFTGTILVVVYVILHNRLKK